MGTFMRQLLKKHRPELPQIGLLAALVVLFAWRVGTPVLHIWDEARLAVNAAEMLDSGDWLVTRYHGQPDLWNTKPPLLIWLQAAGLRLLGYTTWVIRLPSVLAALATAWLVYRLGRYALGSRSVGIFAALILATSPGFNGTHVARFGDYDALLCLGLTGAALSWYRYIRQRRAGPLWRGACWFAVALLTKSAAAVLLLPAVALYAAIWPAGRWVFGQGRTYAAVAVAALPLAAFYGLREAAAPGYLAATWFNDWYGRLSQHIVTVDYPWWVYAQRLAFPGLLTWSPFLLVGIWAGTRGRGMAAPKQEFARFATVYILVFTALISVARTRLLWYSAPIYPLAALLCAIGLEHLTQQAAAVWRWPRHLVTGLLALAFLLPGGLLLHHEWRRWEVEKADPMMQYGYQIPQILASQPRLRTFTILRGKRDNSVLDFYVAALRKRGIQPRVQTVADSVSPTFLPHERVLICTEPLQRRVHRHYFTQRLAAVAPGEFVEILGYK